MHAVPAAHCSVAVVCSTAAGGHATSSPAGCGAGDNHSKCLVTTNTPGSIDKIQLSLPSHPSYCITSWAHSHRSLEHSKTAGINLTISTFHSITSIVSVVDGGQTRTEAFNPAKPQSAHLYPNTRTLCQHLHAGGGAGDNHSKCLVTTYTPVSIDKFQLSMPSHPS